MEKDFKGNNNIESKQGHKRMKFCSEKGRWSVDYNCNINCLNRAQI